MKDEVDVGFELLEVPRLVTERLGVAEFVKNAPTLSLGVCGVGGVGGALFGAFIAAESDLTSELALCTSVHFRTSKSQVFPEFSYRRTCK